MKKKLLFAWLALGWLVVPLVGETITTGAFAATAAAQQPGKADSTAVRMIERFYADYVFGRKEYTSAIETLCTERLRRRLKEANPYDDGYAIWCFRSGAQDGPEEESRITAIGALGEGRYEVRFSDMGIVGSRIVKIVGEPGAQQFDAIE